ncbi:MAG: YdcF family protein [Bacteroidetes bacterium]|nr:YdcF family protein [Bacteroidota bacterium]
MKIRIYLLIFSSLLIILLFTFWANYKIVKTSEPFIFENINDLPTIETGLLLGTSKYLNNGNVNQYFKNRIKATIELYKAGKIKYIIISGDNSRKDYNEPLDMKNELVNSGIPDSAIYLDYAGFRTFDSVIRAKKIFGQNKLISISQKFHNERTVFIARKNEIEAYGYNAKDVNAYMGFKTNLREFFARTKVFLDILINREPKFLGEKIQIGK